MTEQIDNWNEKNYPFKIINIKYYSLIFILLFLIIIGLIGGLVYLGYNDKFKSELACGNSTLVCGNLTTDCGDFNIPEYPDCNVDCDCPDFNIPDDYCDWEQFIEELNETTWE